MTRFLFVAPCFHCGVHRSSSFLIRSENERFSTSPWRDLALIVSRAPQMWPLKRPALRAFDRLLHKFVIFRGCHGFGQVGGLALHMTVVLISSRRCPACTGPMVYRKTLMTWLNGGYFRRTCQSCGYRDRKRVKLVKNSYPSSASPAVKDERLTSSPRLAALGSSHQVGNSHVGEKEDERKGQSWAQAGSGER